MEAILGIALSQETISKVEDKSIGFKFGDKGAHTSRTIMVDEVTHLFQECPPESTPNEYRTCIVENNCLGKKTAATRKLTCQRLNELYGLDPTILLLRVMRQLWLKDEKGRPLLALLICLARDPLLRATANPILRMRPGDEIARQQVKEELLRAAGHRFNEDSLDKVIRNTSSSWTQSGHLEGRSRKIRRAVNPTVHDLVYALLLGYILGARGESLLDTLWTKVLDASKESLLNLAQDAKRFGYIDLKLAGGIVDLSLTPMLTDAERRLIHGTD